MIALLATMTPVEKNTVLTGGYKSKLADPLDRHEMARAVTNLGFTLATKLEWVAAAAGGAEELGYKDIKALIVAAPQDQRDILKSGAWREFFIDVCGDETILQAVADLQFDLVTKLDWIGGEYDLDDLGYAQIQPFIANATQAERDVLKTRPWRDWFTAVCTDKTMATAVMDLRFDLKTKLAWMIYEDTNLDLVGMVIRNTPAAELPAVAADAAFMKSLRDELGESQYKFAEAMLTRGLLGQATVDTDPSSFDIDIDRRALPQRPRGAEGGRLLREGHVRARRLQHAQDAGLQRRQQLVERQVQGQGPVARRRARGRRRVSDHGARDRELRRRLHDPVAWRQARPQQHG